MNTAIYTGRLTKDPEIRYTQGDNSMCVASFTVAVDRRHKSTNSNEPQADFIPCKCFGKMAEFVEKYLKKGIKVEVRGATQTGFYTNRDGVKVYTWETVLDEVQFAESKAASSGGSQNGNSQNAGNGGQNGNGQSGNGQTGSGNSQPSNGNSRSNGNGQNAGNGGGSQNSNSQNASPSSLNGFNAVDDDDELPFS